MPIETPDAIRSRVPPSTRHNGTFCWRANRSLAAVQFRHIAVQRHSGAGKTPLAERLGTRLDATVVLDDTENPFIAVCYADRPGAALQAELFYLLTRHRQQTTLRQTYLFSQTT